jgi:integral membrane protein (TIGR00529 family)
MLDLIKVLSVFGLILFLLRLRWNIGYVLILASGVLSLLYLMPLLTIIETIKVTVLNNITIKLFFALTLIRMLEMVFRERDFMTNMMKASKDLLKKRKAVIISMPLLIGMLPSLGGAYFSAPMVEESTRGLKMAQEEKAFINYWYRHPWEYILPLYPGILFASAVTKIELRSLILSNMVYATIIFLSGFFLSMREIKIYDDKEKKKIKEKSIIKTVMPFIPIMTILLLVILFHLELHTAIGIIIFFLLLFYRYKLKEILEVFKYGITKEVISIVFGTMLFKFTMENSGVVANLSGYFTEKGIPLLPILFFLPFISGLLTGLTVGFVGSTFPLLISISKGAHLNEITFAFASGFVGVLLSPVHLCLVLTREYFKADMWGIYKKIIPGCGLIMVGALIMYFTL